MIGNANRVIFKVGEQPNQENPTAQRDIHYKTARKQFPRSERFARRKNGKVQMDPLE
jgi:hypothetical protein